MPKKPPPPGASQKGTAALKAMREDDKALMKLRQVSKRKVKR